MMPEIVPGGDFGANIDRLFTERSMVMQAWGAYGVLWPVVHQWLGVSPDLGRGRVAVVPQLPAGPAARRRCANIRLAVVQHRRACGAATGHATSTDGRSAAPRSALTIGAVRARRVDDRSRSGSTATWSTARGWCRPRAAWRSGSDAGGRSAVSLIPAGR